MSLSSGACRGKTLFCPRGSAPKSGKRKRNGLCRASCDLSEPLREIARLTLHVAKRNNNKKNNASVSLPAPAENRKVERHEKNILLTTRRSGASEAPKLKAMWSATRALFIFCSQLLGPPIALAPEKQTPPSARGDAAGRDACFAGASVSSPHRATLCTPRLLR